MHFCTAYIQIAGDREQVIYRDKFSPVSWPEVEVLRKIHGDESVLEVKPFVHVEQRARDEKVRLIALYGKAYVEEAHRQGRGDDIRVDAAEADIAHGEIWKNPLTNQEEIIEGEPPALDTTKLKSKSKQAEAAF